MVGATSPAGLVFCVDEFGPAESPEEALAWAGTISTGRRDRSRMPNHCSASQAWNRSTSVNPSFAARRLPGAPFPHCPAENDLTGHGPVELDDAHAKILPGRLG